LQERTLLLSQPQPYTEKHIMSHAQTLPGVTPAQEKEAVRVRRIGQDIIQAIDLDHVHTMGGLVEVFEIALDRAKRERNLDRDLSESITKPFRPGFRGWLERLF
jgi:hypothetical protein